uniref:Uncharacterized protein n=1 Tax=Rhizophora mucronata TaxID=61149 RepID=A0A2P2IIJ7_RHIMU
MYLATILDKSQSKQSTD